jgi:hypothetical protein
MREEDVTERLKTGHSWAPQTRPPLVLNSLPLWGRFRTFPRSAELVTIFSVSGAGGRLAYFDP